MDHGEASDQKGFKDMLEEWLLTLLEQLCVKAKVNGPWSLWA